MGDRGVEREGLGVAPASQTPGQRPFGVEPASAVSSIAATPNAGLIERLRFRFRRRDLESGTGYLTSDGRSGFTTNEVWQTRNPDGPEAAQRIEDLELALGLALDVLIEWEPGDSRAVSAEFVAMAAILAGQTQRIEECRGIVRNARAELASAAGARSAETNEDSAQSVGRQSGDAKQRDAQPSRSREP